MSLGERAEWLILGMVIGFILGRIVSRLQNVEQKVDSVDKQVKGTQNRDQLGFMRFPLVADALYFLVLIIVVWGTVSAQKASNEVEETQGNLEQVSECNRVYLSSLLSAVEPRTESTLGQAQANVDLQKAWYRFVRYQLHVPPHPEEKQREKAHIYAERLKDFLDATKNNMHETLANPYPTEKQLVDCINEGEGKDE